MLTASIVLYKNPLKECQQIIQTLLECPIVEKIYLVDHSPDRKLDILQNLGNRICYIPHKNSGYGAGHNVAIREAVKINSDGYHVILNSDLVFQPSVLRILADFMDSNPGAGLCMPDILNPDGSRQYLCKYLPSPLDLFGKRFLPKKWMENRLSHMMMKDADFSKVLSVPWLSGCFMFLRMNILKKVDGFDERFFMYGEDIDLSRRIHEISDTLYCPYVHVIHAHVAASYHSWKMLLVHIKNVSIYFNKWGWFCDVKRKKINSTVAVRNRNQSGSLNNHNITRR